MNPTHSTPVTDPTPADVLRRAADHIERHGFNQGSYYDNTNCDHPAACAHGALIIAAFGEPMLHAASALTPGAVEHVDAFHWLNEHLRANLDAYKLEPICVYSWNDSPTTTGQDVIDTLRAAADAWDTAHAPSEA